LLGSRASAAVDLGGVSKEFLSTLVSALKTEKVIPLDSWGLPYLIADQTSLSWRLESLGKLYSLVYEKNSLRADKFLLGTLFHPDFFQLVALVGSGDDEEAGWLHPCARALMTMIPSGYHLPFEIVLAAESSEGRRELIASYAEILGGLSHEEAIEIAQMEVKKYGTAARSFYQGCSRSFQQLLKHNLEQGGVFLKQLLSVIQGEIITQEGLVRALTLTRSHELLEQRRDWIVRHILLNDVAWSEKFVKAVTGQQSLLGTKIELRLHDSPHFEIHTCFNRLEIPSRRYEERDFLLHLDSILSDRRYNIS
jgi:hypothetical protein